MPVDRPEWVVEVRDPVRHQPQTATVAVSEAGELVIVAPPPGSFVLTPDGKRKLVEALNAAESVIAARVGGYRDA